MRSDRLKSVTHNSAHKQSLDVLSPVALDRCTILRTQVNVESVTQWVCKATGKKYTCPTPGDWWNLLMELSHMHGHGLSTSSTRFSDSNVWQKAPRAGRLLEHAGAGRSDGCASHYGCQAAAIPCWAQPPFATRGPRVQHLQIFAVHSMGMRP